MGGSFRKSLLNNGLGEQTVPPKTWRDQGSGRQLVAGVNARLPECVLSDTQRTSQHLDAMQICVEALAEIEIS
jgi:hypothetical protein